MEEYIIPTEREMSRRSSQGRGKSARFSIVCESSRNVTPALGSPVTTRTQDILFE